MDSAVHAGMQSIVRVNYNNMAMQSSSKYEIPLAIVGSFLTWSDVYLILQAINRKRSPEWNCRIVTAVHGVISTVLCFTSAVITGPWPFTHVGESNTNLHDIIMIISLGYFLFDCSWCMVIGTESKVMLAHHLVSIFGLAYSLFAGRSGCELTAVTGASELTNPLLQFRWFLKETGRYKGWLAKSVDFTFLLLFWLARLGIGSVFHYVCQTSPKVDLLTKLGGQAFYIISLIFGIQLLIFFVKKYIRIRRPSV